MQVTESLTQCNHLETCNSSALQPQNKSVFVAFNPSDSRGLSVHAHCDHQNMNSPCPKPKICGWIRGQQCYPTGKTVGFVWLHPSFQRHLWPFKPHWPPVFPFSKTSVAFPCLTQRRRDPGKPDSAMYCSAAFGKEVMSNPQRSIIGHVWGAFAILKRVIAMLTEVTRTPFMSL